MKTHTGREWIVQPDPKWKGKHPYHDTRFITTDDFDFDDNFSEGSIICTMRDTERHREDSALIAAAPKLLAALDNLQANPNSPRAHRIALDALAKARAQ